jgi:hypothetical protein
LKAWARNDREFDPQSSAAPGLLQVRRDQEYLKQVLNYILKTPDGPSEQPSQPVVLDPNWEKAPWANLPRSDQPVGWTEQGKPVLIVLPVSPKSLSNVLGPWLAEHVTQNRNMVRFLLPKADSHNFYDDRNLLITARCALLASEWKQTDQQYTKLHLKYEGALKSELKNRFDRYALLATWDFQTPSNCMFNEEAHGATGADIPAAVEKHVIENYFASEDFEAFIIQAAGRNETLRQILALLREPPLPGQTAIPYLGDVNIYEQVLRVVAKDKVALNASGRWWSKEPGESNEDALARLRQRVWLSGQAMFAVQLGETSQVGSGGVVVTPRISPEPARVFSGPVVQPEPASPIPLVGGEMVPTTSVTLQQPQPVIRQSLGPKTGMNLLGELERWALPDAQKVIKASLTLNGISVKELRDLCIKLPPKLQAELQVILSPEGDSTK